MKYAYWLHNISGIGNSKIRNLYAHAECAEEIYHMSLSHLKKIVGITEDDIKEIHNSRRRWDVDKEWFRLMEQGIGFVSLEQMEFPEKIRNIPNPPYALYYVGKLPDEKGCWKSHGEVSSIKGHLHESTVSNAHPEDLRKSLHHRVGHIIRKTPKSEAHSDQNKRQEVIPAV